MGTRTNNYFTREYTFITWGTILYNMPELNYKAQWVPSKEEVKEYLDNSQLFPLNIQALGFELLKLIRRVNELENGKKE